jgi:uncharacterized protein YjbI with pentapeptide repeats
MFDFLKRLFNPPSAEQSTPQPIIPKLARNQVKQILAAKDKGTLLRNVDLSGENLSELNFAGVDMDKVKFIGANLIGCDLRKAYLARTDFTDADLTEADLREANLSVANLSRANLKGADLSHANCSSANLTDADLTGATLIDCYLGSTKLFGVTLPDGTKYTAKTNLSQFGVKDTQGNKLRGV